MLVGQIFGVRRRTVGLAAALLIAGYGAGPVGASSVPPAGADGEPIVFMNISSLESPQFAVPQVQVAIEARVAVINAAGGVNGRPLEVEFCNDRFDPNEASACARRAAEIGAVAIVGGTTAQAATILPILQEESIPWVGGSGTSGMVELTEPISFPIQGGSTAMLMGVGSEIVRQGATNVAVIEDDNPSSQSGSAGAIRGIEAAGGSAVVTTAPAGTVDFTAIVATALEDDVDGVAITSTPNSAPKIILALRQAGFEGVIGTTSSLIPESVIATLGDAANGILLGFRMVPVTSTDNPAIVEFRDAVTALDPDVQIDELALNAWEATLFFSEVVGRLDTVDGPSIIAALENVTEPYELDVVPDYGSMAAPEEFPQAVNFVAVIGVVTDGQIVQETDFINPMEP